MDIWIITDHGLKKLTISCESLKTEIKSVWIFRTNNIA
jgi:hypothetical protein